MKTQSVISEYMKMIGSKGGRSTIEKLSKEAIDARMAKARAALAKKRLDKFTKAAIVDIEPGD